MQEKVSIHLQIVILFTGYFSFDICNCYALTHESVRKLMLGNSRRMHVVLRYLSHIADIISAGLILYSLPILLQGIPTTTDVNYWAESFRAYGVADFQSKCLKVNEALNVCYDILKRSETHLGKVSYFALTFTTVVARIFYIFEDLRKKVTISARFVH